MATGEHERRVGSALCRGSLSPTALDTASDRSCCVRTFLLASVDAKPLGNALTIGEPRLSIPPPCPPPILSRFLHNDRA
jgi:hypothetical protein